MGGLLIVASWRRWPSCSALVGRLDLLAPLAALARRRRLGAFDDYLNVRTGDGIRGPPEAHLADRRGRRRRAVTSSATSTSRALAVPFDRRRAIIAPPGLHRLRGVRHRGHQQRREHHRRARRPGRRDAHLRLRRLHDHRPAQRAAPAEPGPALRAHHRRDCSASCGSTSTRRRSSWATRARCRWAPRLAVTALITGQILVLPLIGIIFVVETGSVILQVGYFKADRRQAHLPDGPAPPPLRAGRLGRGEDHPALLDRRRPGRRCSA